MITLRIFGNEYKTEHSLETEECAEFISEVITSRYPNGVWRILTQESEFSLSNIVEIMQDIGTGKKIFKSAPILFGITMNEVPFFEQAFIIVDTRG